MSDEQTRTCSEPDKELEQQQRDRDEFEALCRPLVEYLQKKYHPHAWIITE